MNPATGPRGEFGVDLDRLLGMLGDRLSDDESRHVRMLVEYNEPEAALIEITGLVESLESGVSDAVIELLAKLVVYEDIDPGMLPSWLCDRVEALGAPPAGT